MLQIAELGAESLFDFFHRFMILHGKYQAGKTRQSYYNSVNNISLCLVLYKCPLSQITQKLMKKYMRQRQELHKASNASVNRELALVSKMLSVAVEQELIPSNPLRGMKKLKEEKREVNLTKEQAGELIALLREKTPTIANIVLFALYTGFRKENILSLQIDQIIFHDFKGTGQVDLTVKGGKRSTFPLSTMAVKVLKQAIGIRAEGYVFLNPGTGRRYFSIHRTFDNAVRALGLTAKDGSKLRIHDLRHVFATWLREAGVGKDDIQDLMGHRDSATTTGYIHHKVLGDPLELLPQIPA